MRVLISNDDGYRAPGIIALAEAIRNMSQVKHVDVIAPDRDCSGASSSLTLLNPLRTSVTPNGFISVHGTPTDCVHLGVSGLLETPPDVVVSGINAGANLGDDAIYSGTIAAAIEGRFLGLPAIAMSLASNSANLTHYDTAAKVAQTLLEKMEPEFLPPNTILSVNVPDVPWGELQGMVSTRLGNRHKAEQVIKAEDPRGRPIYWLGPPGPTQDDGPGTDFHAIKNNLVSITPLHIDLTRHLALDDVNNWLKQF